MLREIDNISQPEGEPKRRWFSSSEMDLILWLEGHEPIGFQLCYDKGKDEHAFTWMKNCGWTHRRIEDGEHIGAHHKMTPILVPDGIMDVSRIQAEFEAASAGIDGEVKELVLRVLRSIGA